MAGDRDAPAAAPLTTLQAELSGVKSQWEYLQDRIANGYNAAYNYHVGALNDMKLARLKREQEEARRRGIYMFVFSVVSVGFAGGLVGGLFGPWLNEFDKASLTKAWGEGVKGIGSRTAQQLVNTVVPQNATPASVSSSPYIAVVPDKFDAYAKNKERLDGCFAEANKWVQDLKNLANVQNWGADVGWQTLNSFRQHCPLLTDAPNPHELPSEAATEKAAELMMWKVWARARDLKYWDDLYARMGKPENQFTRVGLIYDEDGSDIDAARDLVALDWRMMALDVDWFVRRTMIWRQHLESPQGEDNHDFITDLRKLSNLPLSGMSDLPFAKMKHMEFAQLDSFELRGRFLDGLQDVRPFHATH
jgi:hypothetical protein